MSIEVTLLKDGRELGCITVTGHLELGRRDQTDSRLSRTVPFDADIPGGKRWVIADAGSNRIPRKVCSIDVIGEGRVKVTNIHNSNKHLWVDESGTKTPILPEESVERMLPISLILPDDLCVKVAAKAIEVVAPTPIPEPSSSRWESGGLGQVSSKRSSSGLESSGSWSSSNSSNSGSWNSGSTPLGFAGTVFAVESDQGVNDAVKSVLDAMKRVITALQEPIDNFAKYYEGLSKVIIDELKMDRVAIIRYMTNLATGEQSWDIQGRSEVVRDRKSGEQPPLTMSLLNRVLKTKSLAVYPNDDDLGPSESQSFLNYAIAAPLKAQTAEGEKVTGVLYADRNKSTLSADQSDFFSQNEKDLLDILVSAIALRESTAEKERGVATYRQFFPKKVIDKLVDKGQDFLEGRDTEVSVLFCDIRNFSKITHDLPAKDSMLWLNDTLEELSKCVLANDGVLVDYVGDELFAMWGAPEEDATHPLKCIKTAISMMELKKKLREKHGGIGAKIDFGLGLNSGKARVGNTGSKLKIGRAHV